MPNFVIRLRTAISIQKRNQPLHVKASLVRIFLLSIPSKRFVNDKHVYISISCTCGVVWLSNSVNLIKLQFHVRIAKTIMMLLVTLSQLLKAVYSTAPNPSFCNQAIKCKSYNCMIDHAIIGLTLYCLIAKWWVVVEEWAAKNEGGEARVRSFVNTISAYMQWCGARKSPTTGLKLKRAAIFLQ
jgi:hypothetical protein